MDEAIHESTRQTFKNKTLQNDIQRTLFWIYSKYIIGNRNLVPLHALKFASHRFFMAFLQGLIWGTLLDLELPCVQWTRSLEQETIETSGESESETWPA